MNLLGLLSLKAWLIIGGVLLIGTNAVTAVKVAGYVRTKFETVNLKNEVKYVTRELKVAVLDGQTLAKALEEQKTRLENKAEFERKIDEHIHKRQLEAADGKRWCELDADELRVWNDENRGSFGDVDSTVGARSREKLPDSSTSP